MDVEAPTEVCVKRSRDDSFEFSPMGTEAFPASKMARLEAENSELRRNVDILTKRYEEYLPKAAFGCVLSQLDNMKVIYLLCFTSAACIL
jgi:hypothetical protein